MRVVLDTNILVSALISTAGNPSATYNAWQDGRFTLLTWRTSPWAIRGRRQGG
jgi:predicted nucleic acid-binding protein